MGPCQQAGDRLLHATRCSVRARVGWAINMAQLAWQLSRVSTACAALAAAQLRQQEHQAATRHHGLRAQRQRLPQRVALQVRAARGGQAALPPRQRLLFVPPVPGASYHGVAQHGARAVCRELAKTLLLTELWRWL